MTKFCTIIILLLALSLTACGGDDEDDGVTPRYIEVKTTTGGVMQPFYYSDNELQFSEQQRRNYYVYRVFNFKSATKQADILIIHGSLKDLNGKPISYKVSLHNQEKEEQSN